MCMLLNVLFDLGVVFLLIFLLIGSLFNFLFIKQLYISLVYNLLVVMNFVENKQHLPLPIDFILPKKYL